MQSVHLVWEVRVLCHQVTANCTHRQSQEQITSFTAPARWTELSFSKKTLDLDSICYLERTGYEADWRGQLGWEMKCTAPEPVIQLHLEHYIRTWSWHLPSFGWPSLTYLISSALKSQPSGMNNKLRKSNLLPSMDAKVCCLHDVFYYL